MQYTCQSCSMRFPQSDLLSHYITQHTSKGRELQPLYTCELPNCSSTFTARHYFRIHLERAHSLGLEEVMALMAGQESIRRRGNEGDRPKCEFRGVPVIYENTSDSPAPQQGYYDKAPLNEAYDLPPPPDTVLQKLLCPLCGTGFLSSKNLQRHMDSTHPTPSQIMNYTSTDTWCRDCSKTFSSKYNLDRHLELHRGVKYPCGVCKKVYTQKYAWSQHMKVTHGEVQMEDNLW